MIVHEFEGPPSDDDMQTLVARLLFDGEVEEAHRIAALMVSHWLDMPLKQREHDHTRHFSYWLGVRSATANIVNGRKTRMVHRGLLGRTRARTSRAGKRAV